MVADFDALYWEDMMRDEPEFATRGRKVSVQDPFGSVVGYYRRVGPARYEAYLWFESRHEFDYVDTVRTEQGAITLIEEYAGSYL